MLSFVGFIYIFGTNLGVDNQMLLLNYVLHLQILLTLKLVFCLFTYIYV